MGLHPSGSGVGGITLAPFFGFLIKKFGLRTTFQTYAILALLPLIGGFLIRRKVYVVETIKKEKESKMARLCSCFDKKVMTNKAFILYTVAMSAILFSYYIPFVHLVSTRVFALGKFVRTRSEMNANIDISMMRTVMVVTHPRECLHFANLLS